MALTVLRWSGFHSATRRGDMYGQRLSLPLIMHSDTIRDFFLKKIKCSITRRNHYNIPLYIIGPRMLMQTPNLEISLPNTKALKRTGFLNHGSAL